MQVKNKKIGSGELDLLIGEGRWEEVLAARTRRVNWLYNNRNRTAMVVDEKIVLLMLQSLRQKIRELENPVKKIKDPNSEYDEFFGDGRICKCGHLYRQHFDSAENMRHIGCKYCSCYDFKEDVPSTPVKI